MKRVFSSPDIEQARKICDLLEDEDIKVTLLNDESASLPFGGNAVQWPSVWVLDNAQAIEAIQIVKAFEDDGGWEESPKKCANYQS